MKLYQNSICGMLISGCADCPNRFAQRYKTAKGFRSGPACKVIYNTSSNPITGKELRICASVSEALLLGGCHAHCPLPDSESVIPVQTGIQPTRTNP